MQMAGANSPEMMTLEEVRQAADLFQREYKRLHPHAASAVTFAPPPGEF